VSWDISRVGITLMNREPTSHREMWIELVEGVLDREHGGGNTPSWNRSWSGRSPRRRSFGRVDACGSEVETPVGAASGDRGRQIL
jgi:hypothetical protein